MNLKELAILYKLITAADSGEWHRSGDCKVENRSKDCGLCQALKQARKLMRESNNEAKR